MKKKILLFSLVLISMFFINYKVVYALDNPRMELDKKPNGWLNTSQFAIINSINTTSLKDSNGNLTCPTVYIMWTSPSYGQQGSSADRSYIATFEKSTTTDNRQPASLLNTSQITSTSLSCKYSFDGPGSDDYEFSIYYDKTADTNSNKTKLKDCLYFNTNPNYIHADNSSENYVGFTIYTDGTVGGAAGFGTLAGYKVSYSGGNTTTCPPYVSVSIGATYDLKPSNSETDWKLGDGSEIKNNDDQQETGEVNYLAYNNPKAPKIILKKDAVNGGYKFILLESKNSKGKEIKVQNASDYIGAFNDMIVENYPTWLNQTVDDNNETIYVLSMTKDDMAKTNYICQAKIFSIYGGGTDEIQNTCESIFGPDFLAFLDSNIFSIVRIAIPVILILLTSFDFFKVIYSDDKDGMQKAWKNCYRRIIVAVLIYLIPMFITFVANIVGASDVKECTEYLENLKNDGSGEVSN